MVFTVIGSVMGLVGVAALILFIKHLALKADVNGERKI